MKCNLLKLKVIVFTVSLFSLQATGNYFEVAIVNKIENKEITVRSQGTCMKYGY